MRIDTLKKFSKLRNALIRERTLLENRLAQINAIVGPTSTTDDTKAAPTSRQHRNSGQRRRRSGMSLRQAVIKVTSEKPLTKDEILEAVKKIGYRFSTDRPMASINAHLYQKGAFKRRNGRFSPGNSGR